jgi:hypothetical protein
MAEQVLQAGHRRINRALKYVGLCVLILAVLSLLIDLTDWYLRKPTSSVSSYTFAGNTIVFSGMTSGSIEVAVGEPGTVTIVRRVTEGIRKLRINEQAHGNTFVVQESGGCNSVASLALLGGCTSQYQVQVPANTRVVANIQNTSISVDRKNSSHWLKVGGDTATLQDGDVLRVTYRQRT